MRKAYNSVLKLPKLIACSQCSEPCRPHHVCPRCGFYSGHKKSYRVLTVKVG